MVSIRCGRRTSGTGSSGAAIEMSAAFTMPSTTRVTRDVFGSGRKLGPRSCRVNPQRSFGHPTTVRVRPHTRADVRRGAVRVGRRRSAHSQPVELLQHQRTSLHSRATCWGSRSSGSRRAVVLDVDADQRPQGPSSGRCATTTRSSSAPTLPVVLRLSSRACNPMKDDDRFAGLGAEAPAKAERESVVDLALAVAAAEVVDGPGMTGETAAGRYLQLKVGQRECEVFGCLFLTTRNSPTDRSTGPRCTREPAAGAQAQRGRLDLLPQPPGGHGRAEPGRHAVDVPHEGFPRRDRGAAARRREISRHNGRSWSRRRTQRAMLSTRRARRCSWRWRWRAPVWRLGRRSGNHGGTSQYAGPSRPIMRCSNWAIFWRSLPGGNEIVHRLHWASVAAYATKSLT